jgi:signal transduction histidine kinase
LQFNRLINVLLKDDRHNLKVENVVILTFSVIILLTTMISGTIHFSINNILNSKIYFAEAIGVGLLFPIWYFTKKSDLMAWGIALSGIFILTLTSFGEQPITTGVYRLVVIPLFMALVSQKAYEGIIAGILSIIFGVGTIFANENLTFFERGLSEIARANLICFIVTCVLVTSLAFLFKWIMDRAYKEVSRHHQITRALLRVLNHDISNPLGVIMGLVRSNEIDAIRAAKIKTASHSIHSIVEYVKNVQAYQHGTLKMHISSYPVKFIEKHILDIFDYRFDQKGLIFNFDNRLDEGERISVDPVCFKNFVISNLISNAIKFSHEGGEINFFVDRSTLGEIQITLQDFGIGISPERIEHLYDEYEDTSTLGTMEETGTGFGLPTVKFFVEQFNGRIEVESSLGGGTTFKLFL